MLLKSNLRIAIVHDWFVTVGGGEYVVEVLLACFPQADLFTLVDFYPDHLRSVLNKHKVLTSFIQKLPFAKTKHRTYLPLMPLAIEQFDLSAYDIIISSSAALSKGVITGPDQLHICYIHSPMRYAWDLQHQYLRQSFAKKSLGKLIAIFILHYMRIWDLRTVPSVDFFIANSKFIARRVYKLYRRESSVINPPVDIDFFKLQTNKSDYFVTAQRLVPYKRVDLIVNAFNQMPDLKLIVIGNGPDLEKIKKMANSNISFLGFVERPQLLEKLQNAKAFIMAAEEDFGILPVEAQACGTPVIAYGKGGAIETVIHGKTGVLFDDQTEASLIQAVKFFNEHLSAFDPSFIRVHAEKFSRQSFELSISDFVNTKYLDFKNKITTAHIEKH
jgi:glycosyltransferase involved in cell wall biosynthesis